jgi:predicted MFS family arabinose efflux permease
VRATLFTPEFVRLLLANSAFQFGFSTFFLLPKFMAQELHSGPSEIGALPTAFGLAMVVAVPLTGRLLDRLGNRQVLLVGSALAVVAALGYLAVDRVGPALFCLRCVQGLALSLFINAGSVMAADRAPHGRLAEAMGLFAASGMIMTAVAPSLAEVVAASAGYAPTFVAASAAALIALTLARGLAPEEVRTVRAVRLSSLLRRRSTVRMLAVLGATGLGFGAMFAFSSPFSLELGVVNVRGFFLSFTAGALFVRLGFGRVIDRVGHRRSATCALFGYAAAVGAMYLLTPARLAPLGALFGVAHGLFIPAFTAFVVSNAAVHERGTVLTLFNGAFNVGNSMVFALGFAAERYGYPSVFAATGAIVLTAPLVLLGWPHRTELAKHVGAEGSRDVAGVEPEPASTQVALLGVDAGGRAGVASGSRR